MVKFSEFISENWVLGNENGNLVRHLWNVVKAVKYVYTIFMSSCPIHHFDRSVASKSLCNSFSKSASRPQFNPFLYMGLLLSRHFAQFPRRSVISLPFIPGYRLQFLHPKGLANRQILSATAFYVNAMNHINLIVYYVWISYYGNCYDHAVWQSIIYITRDNTGAQTSVGYSLRSVRQSSEGETVNQVNSGVVFDISWKFHEHSSSIMLLASWKQKTKSCSQGLKINIPQNRRLLLVRYPIYP